MASSKFTNEGYDCLKIPNKQTNLRPNISQIYGKFTYVFDADSRLHGFKLAFWVQFVDELVREADSPVCCLIVFVGLKMDLSLSVSNLNLNSNSNQNYFFSHKNCIATLTHLPWTKWLPYWQTTISNAFS